MERSVKLNCIDHNGQRCLKTWTLLVDFRLLAILFFFFKAPPTTPARTQSRHATGTIELSEESKNIPKLGRRRGFKLCIENEQCYRMRRKDLRGYSRDCGREKCECEYVSELLLSRSSVGNREYRRQREIEEREETKYVVASWYALCARVRGT